MLMLYAQASNETQSSQPLPRRHRVFIERDYSQGLTLRFSSVFPQELERKMSKEDFEFVIHAFNDLYARAERITFATILENVASMLTCHTMLLCCDTQFQQAMRQVQVFVEEQNEQMIRAGALITLHDPAERHFRMVGHLILQHIGFEIEYD
ncbi:golgin subfamily A member 7-like isoform X2 [Paramacrobiotus metropolitanus]|uniref:golgin subfamily A member 7-like isoform X2 n=1 Tax=Paramacrobiotus metropolitanus TaxID=2943436 RepID=UPI0024464D4E|nr:golgin subfamily A member 7-like isoform X2 [Paramacrobiotus metropolitanus]